VSLRARLAALAGTALAGAATYALSVEPYAVQVRSITLILPRLDAAFHGLRLAHISDIHINGWMTPARLAALVPLVNAQGAEIIAITGDILSSDNRYNAGELAAALAALRAPEGVFAVLGNHDHRHRDGAAGIRRVLEQAGIAELANRAHTLRRGAAALHLAGVDDMAYRRARLDCVLAELPPDGAAVLLAHEPDFADVSAATGRFDLQLSGHTHGGQVHLPPFGPLVLPKYGMRYPAGLYRARDMYVYTNRGLGAGHLRARFNCRPEITVFTLWARRPPS